MGPQGGDSLYARVVGYLRAHHTMTVATTAPAGNTPHAANVFYAVDDDLRLVFLSQTTSVHACHIGEEAPVAVTVSEDYGEWEMIQGVQMWGRVRLLGGGAKAGALVLYLRRFPFVRDVMSDPLHAAKMRDIGVYRVDPEKAGFTDNTSGVFGRETLELVRK